MLTKWDERFLELAEFISKWSKDPSTKTGAVIVDGKRIVSVGYNGFAKDIIDLNLEDRELKYKKIIHCEVNAILFANRSLNNTTLYTWPFISCSPCAAIVIQSGIKRCVAPKNDTERWQADFKISRQMFKEAKVELIEC